jgi:alkanesulfonate monooxygenase SsuD/methylene tetrahydromethanopterin reductase-like flavin-dependent oxidoreductase (luciferase family)
MAASLDVISGGRFDLGIGWGSVPPELEKYGFGPEPPAVRAAKLRESLEIVELMFAGEPFDYAGKHFQLRDAIGRTVPVQARVPVHLGGGGPKLTMPLVAEFADWWNCPGYALERLDELRPLAGNARISTQHPIGLALDDAGRDDALALVQKRFGTWGGVIGGTAADVAEGLASDVRRGVEGFVLQFADFGTPETIRHFMGEVAPAVRAAGGS